MRRATREKFDQRAEFVWHFSNFAPPPQSEKWIDAAVQPPPPPPPTSKKLPAPLCQPIHHNRNQKRDQSRTLVQSFTNIKTIHRTLYLLGPFSVSRYPMSSTTFTYFSSLFFLLLYVLRLNPNDFQSSPQRIPPPIQGFLHLHTAAAAAATTATTVSSAKNMVLGDSCLTSSVSLSITTANKKGIRADPWCNPKATPT